MIKIQLLCRCPLLAGPASYCIHDANGWPRCTSPEEVKTSPPQWIAWWTCCEIVDTSCMNNYRRWRGLQRNSANNAMWSDDHSAEGKPVSFRRLSSSRSSSSDSTLSESAVQYNQSQHELQYWHFRPWMPPTCKYVESHLHKHLFTVYTNPWKKTAICTRCITYPTHRFRLLGHRTLSEH